MNASPRPGGGAANSHVSIVESADEARATSSAAPESATAGAVIVTLQDKQAETATTPYNPVTAADSRVHGSGQCFVAILAPTASAAVEFLVSQPPGAYVFVKEEDDSLAVYVKFRQAVRTAAVVKSKDWKKARGSIEWNAQLPQAGGIFAGVAPPVHRMNLPGEMFSHLEHCWNRFLPHVQSVVFELCCEAPIDEKSSLDDCTEILASSSPPPLLVMLVPDSCGFYLLNGVSGLREGSAGVYALRQVEFDFSKFSVAVADGTFKPMALLMSTQFPLKRALDPDLTFRSLLGNFQFPERVVLKETVVSAAPASSAAAQNYIELSSNDTEMELLRAVCAACGGLQPLISPPLPDALLTTVDALYAYFASSYTDVRGDAGQHRKHHWPLAKAKLVSSVLPVWIELMVAVAIVCEASSDSALPTGGTETTSGRKKTTQPLSRLARALRFIVSVAASRCDDAAISRIAFLVFRLLALRSRVPVEFVALVRDLCGMNPTFRRLFARAHGSLLLWKAIHSTSKPVPEKLVSSTDSSGGTSTSPSEPKKMSLLKPSLLSERRPSLFSVARKSQSHKDRSLLDMGARASTSNTKFYAFFRLDPHSIESELLKKLARRQFNEQTLSKLEAASGFCCCHRDDLRHQGWHSTCSSGSSPDDDLNAWHTSSEAPVKMLVFEVILQLGKHLLLQDAGNESWDKDVAMMIHSEKFHESLAEEICHTSQRLCESHPTDEQLNILQCRRSVAVECISILFELERKRRRAIATTLGDKKYLLFVAAMQAKLREMNECLASGASDANAMAVLDAYVIVFRWIPAHLLEEWLTLYLGEVFETVGALNEALERCQDGDKHVLTPSIGRLMEMFRVVLERVVDCDLQTLLLRLLDRGFEPILPLLRAAITAQTPINYVAQHQVLSFLNAFAIVDRSLPMRSNWSRVHALDNKKAELNEDDEEMEQRRSELLQCFLFFDEQHEISTWEFLVRLAFSSYDPPTTAPTDEVTHFPTGPTLAVFEPSNMPTEDDDGALDPYHFPTIEMALTLQRTLYASLSPDYDVEVDLSQAIAKHVAGLNECCRLVGDGARSQDSMNLCRVIELHLDCLIALANRRCIIPEIQAALDTNRVLSAVVRHLPWGKTGIKGNQRFGAVTPLSDDLGPTEPKVNIVQVPHIPEQVHSGCEPPSAAGPVPQLRLCLGKLDSGGVSDSVRSTGGGDAGGRVPPLKLSAPAINGILVRGSKLHAPAIVFLVSYMLVEPTHELDDAFCPRYAPVIDQNRTEKTHDDHSDLLWQLQRHLDSIIQLDMSQFERILFDMETTQAFVTALRASAIRNVVRLLCPGLFDHTLYSLRERIHTSSCSQTDAEDGDNGRSLRSPRQEYVAKGATATVYRSTSAVPYPKNVAVKLIDHEHDRDRCGVGAVYNEVFILKMLRGEGAALQLVDFGNHHEEKSYAIVTEWCPCTLAEWRSSFTRLGSNDAPSRDQEGEQKRNGAGEPVVAVPFRACVLMILRCFRKVCVCLTRIHARGVCHFDIKNANLFLRASASDFSHRLLLHGENQELDAEAASLIGCVCFGDFGESLITDTEPKPLRTCLSFISGAPSASSPAPSPTKNKASDRSFLLSRTRGTEAIKSPEVLRIRGNEATKTKVTFASDVWSIGCLLYELVVQELLFENDDWPALYAHLLASPDDSKVLREDHVRKMNAALAPSDERDQRVVNQIIELCALILDRQPQRRPTLGGIVRRVTALIHDVVKLPITSDEKEFMKRVSITKAHSSAASTIGCPSGDWPSDATKPLALFRSMKPPRAREADKEERCAPQVVPRLFWNFFIGGTLPRRPRRRIDGSNVDILACKDFEVAHEHEYVHFVFFSWSPSVEDATLVPSQSPRLTNGDTSDSGLSGMNVISRVYEDERRTVIHVDRRLRRMYQAASKHGSGSAATLLAAQMLRGLVRQAPIYFPVLQRRLRTEPGRVAFVCVPCDDDDSEGGDSNALEDVMSSVLLFFLERSVAVSPLDALATFARDCSPRFLAYPHRAFAHQLSLFSHRQQQTRHRLTEAEKKASSARENHKKHVLVCLCGASVVTLQVSAMRHALATQRCSCASSSGSCASFHPFPAPTTSFQGDASAPKGSGEHQLPRGEGECDGDADLLGVDGAPRLVPPTFIHDAWEEQVVLPMEVQARRFTPVPWVVVEREAVGRLDSILDWNLAAASSPPATTEAASTTGDASSGLLRRASVSFDALKRLTAKDRDSPRPSPPPASSPTSPSTSDPLLRGLSTRASRHGSGEAWSLLECALCRLPMCAAFPDQRGTLALPLLSDARDACSPLVS